jgi:hypothetical protein
MAAERLARSDKQLQAQLALAKATLEGGACWRGERAGKSAYA